MPARVKHSAKSSYLTRIYELVDTYFIRWGLWGYSCRVYPENRTGFDYNRRTGIVNPNYEDDVAEFMDTVILNFPPTERSTGDIDYCLKLYYLFNHGLHDTGYVMNISQSTVQRLIRDAQQLAIGYLSSAVRYKQAPKEVVRAFTWIKEV